MSFNAPGQKRDKAAPYQETFGASDVAAPINLTIRVPVAGPPVAGQYQNASSGFVIIPKTAAAIVVTWKDCNGSSNSITGVTGAAGVPISLPVAATELTATTNVIVVVYWHGNGSRATP